LPLARSAAFLPTVRQRQNLISLCKLIGYRLAGPVASTKELRFTLKAPLVHPVTIPAGTTCKAVLEDGDVVFATVADAVILAGDLVADVAARQGALKREAFVGTERLANTWESELVGAVCCCVSVEEYPPEPAKPRLVLNRSGPSMRGRRACGTRGRSRRGSARRIGGSARSEARAGETPAPGRAHVRRVRQLRRAGPRQLRRPE
jgi:hypothetical protein